MQHAHCSRCKRGLHPAARFCASCGLRQAQPSVGDVEAGRLESLRRIARLHFFVLLGVFAYRVFWDLGLLPDPAASEFGERVLRGFSSNESEQAAALERAWRARIPIALGGALAHGALTIVALWDFSKRPFAWSFVLCSIESVLFALDPGALTPQFNLRWAFWIWSVWVVWALAPWPGERRARPALRVWSRRSTADA